MATAQDVRRLALSLPRTEEALVRDRVKFRVGRLVYVALSPDERSMGFAFPREERAALIASEPEKFSMPVPSDERFNWVRVRLAPLDGDELTELVVGAWAMVVPKRLSADRLAQLEAKAARRCGESAARPEEKDGAGDD
ncbi:MmcQ/YjbR family DNA-binding protein [Streptomyces dysideae]|uniref:MmcQ/YjbR family DNA-binding protein n=1 Tax=Streptomyces dysideae TaxID=909626 RepID=UPI00082B92BC|nr:MmcQ/YjbR family DNA-binding protein [Streptomyces dysideae]